MKKRILDKRHVVSKSIKVGKTDLFWKVCLCNSSQGAGSHQHENEKANYEELCVST